jgi:hypothetical protein
MTTKLIGLSGARTDDMSEVFHIMHDNPLMEDEHFALVFAQAFINTNTVPTQELCERWLREDYVSETELELILETYEEIMEI